MLNGRWKWALESITKNHMKRTFFLFLMMFAGLTSAHAANKTFGNIITSVEPPPYMKSCMRDEECEEVDPLCSNCCGSTIINKRYAAQYATFKSKQCNKSQGGVCDCTPQTVSTIKCKQGKCIKAHTRPNRKEVK